MILEQVFESESRSQQTDSWLDEVLDALPVAEEVDSDRLTIPGSTVEIFDQVSGRYRLAEGPARCFSPCYRQFRTLTLQCVNVCRDFYREIFLTGEFAGLTSLRHVVWTNSEECDAV